VLDDWEAAPVAPHLRATLAFLRKLTVQPATVVPSDVRVLREAGVSEEAIADAIHVCALFDLINRVADSLGVEYLTPEKFERGAALVLAEGY
jgi:alkylhydroperoxidase family enzyme